MLSCAGRRTLGATTGGSAYLMCDNRRTLCAPQRRFRCGAGARYMHSYTCAPRCRHCVSLHPADCGHRPRPRPRCEIAWRFLPLRALPRSIRLQPPRRRGRALPPGPPRRIAGAARRPARGPAEAPNSPYPLGHRGHAPPALLVAGVRTRPTTTRAAPARRQEPSRGRSGIGPERPPTAASASQERPPPTPPLPGATGRYQGTAPALRVI